MSNSATPSVEQLKRALELAQEIKRLETELTSVLGNHNVSGGAASKPAAANHRAPVASAEKPAKRGGKRPLSAEARERIAAAQRRRWAKTKGSFSSAGSAVSGVKVASKSSVSPKKTRTLSPEGRARIAAAARRRWAAHRKGR